MMRRALLSKADREPTYKLPRMANLSVVLCGDMHIRALNFQHRNKDAPTDVLSFEMEDELDYKVSTGHADQHPPQPVYLLHNGPYVSHNPPGLRSRALCSGAPAHEIAR